MSIEIIAHDKLNEYFPYRGKCAFCGSLDARHRLWDAIIDRYKTGETVKKLARDYDLPLYAIKLVLKLKPYQRT